MGEASDQQSRPPEVAEGNKKRRLEDDHVGDDEPDADVKRSKQEEGPSTKKKFLENVPTTKHYQVSFMHVDIVTAVVASVKHGYVITASRDGVVKFWKRLPIQKHDASKSSGGGGDTILTSAAQAKQEQEAQHPCIEFVKSFTAHPGPVRALAMDASGDAVASVSGDGLVKFYDVSLFDVSSFHATNLELGTAACWLDTTLLAVSAASSGDIHMISPQHGLVQTLTLHGSNVVTCLQYNANHNCVLSTDQKGIIELWDATSSTERSGDALNAETEDVVGGDDAAAPSAAAAAASLHQRVGGPLVASRHGIAYTSKMDTDLYVLLRKKTFAVAAAVTPDGDTYALYGADHKVRLLAHATGKVLVTFDERLKVYDKLFAKPPFGLDAMEYGRRAAVEREIAQESTLFSVGLALSSSGSTSRLATTTPQRINLQFDPTGRYILIPTLMGIKCLDWKRRKLVALIGKADASQLRFATTCLAFGEAKVNRQLQLARGRGGTKHAGDDNDEQEERALLNDSLLITTAYNERRIYVFSHVDPLDDSGGEEEPASQKAAVADDWTQKRDVWNEAPTTEDTMYHHGAGGGDAGSGQDVTRAVLRTTQGDIHIELFAQQVPKTIENFVGHAKSGYYDNVIFHRVIKGFMLQTGDPLGDGTGGESIWGGEFEDEFVAGLRHDRPFTVSMANAGPGTNGSQFFITTVPTPWLDNKHTVFGRVTSGFDVCTAIENVKTDDLDKPLEDIHIQNIDLS